MKERMKALASTPMVLLPFAVVPASPPAMFASAAAPPTAIEKAGALALLLATASPVVVFGWVLSS